MKKTLIWSAAALLCLALAVGIFLLCQPKTPAQNGGGAAAVPDNTGAAALDNTGAAGLADTPATLPADLPSTVEITLTQSQQFPYRIEGYDLVLEQLAGYTGWYVENGTNVQARDVAMLVVVSESDFAVEYAQIRVVYADTTLEFQLTALPAGEAVAVQEKNGAVMPQGQPTAITATVVPKAEMGIDHRLQVTDNGDNTLTVENLTDTTIPMVRVFYKYYTQEEGLFVGGIAFTARLTDLGPGRSITIQPSHFQSKYSRVVMATAYDSEG